jgi:hypothetical protein
VNGLKELFSEFQDSIVLAKAPIRDDTTRSNSNELNEGAKPDASTKSELMILCDISDYVLSVKEELFSVFTNERIVCFSFFFLF